MTALFILCTALREVRAVRDHSGSEEELESEGRPSIYEAALQQDVFVRRIQERTVLFPGSSVRRRDERNLEGSDWP